MRSAAARAVRAIADLPAGRRRRAGAQATLVGTELRRGSAPGDARWLHAARLAQATRLLAARRAPSAGDRLRRRAPGSLGIREARARRRALGLAGDQLP